MASPLLLGKARVAVFAAFITIAIFLVAWKNDFLPYTHAGFDIGILASRGDNVIAAQVPRKRLGVGAGGSANELTTNEGAVNEERNLRDGNNFATSGGVAARAEIVSCPACRLGRLPEVKYFVLKMAPMYAPTLKVRFVQGADPTIEFFDAEGQSQGGKVALDPYTKKDIVDLLRSWSIQPTKPDQELNKLLES